MTPVGDPMFCSYELPGQAPGDFEDKPLPLGGKKGHVGDLHLHNVTCKNARRCTACIYKHIYAWEALSSGVGCSIDLCLGVRVLPSGFEIQSAVAILVKDATGSIGLCYQGGCRGNQRWSFGRACCGQAKTAR